ncbi:M15 family metallopeptidase [Microlunatus parietis]|uniref:LAS superfamily LD-carboxypeptidase LdcB n=1 Tax=Microlunatus parietis TaxID=682979 RepID=A0A7Y9I8T6_9ACTN|nr:M15 family metallopeptidase [Microlunatus parietis]NYE71854.1 LAS superfamily LD-carboxypeptidase LdcB [Microlunatus parietis]
MPSSRPAERRSRATALALAFAGAALLGTLGCQAPATESAPPLPAARATSATPGTETKPTPKTPPKAQTKDQRQPRGQAQGKGKLGIADGAVPEGTTVFDDKVPAVGKLDPALLEALREAAGDAEQDGVEFVVNSGWRSTAYQNQLLREAIEKYGSEAEARRWVATPEKSQHVSGDAVDLGPAKATMWLAEHGADYGLCQIYDNEPWHYELRPDADDRGCPARYDDPTEDPRMN